MSVKAIYTSLLLSVFLVYWSQSSFAQQGKFTAEKPCAANKALRHDNPGNVNTIVGRSYPLLDANKQPPTHYLIEIPTAEVTSRRWVSVVCGSIDSAVQQAPSGDERKQGVVPDSIEHVLAASWQPTFCATKRGRVKPECVSQTADRPDATQFSIHGLWPDDLDDTTLFPCYCNSGKPVSCKKRLNVEADVDLSTTLMEQLAVLMPGMQSGLHLHEWSKHGSCYEQFISGDDQGATAEEYFAETVSLLNDLNNSAVKDLFVLRLGEDITLMEMKQRFNAAFGAGAGERVFMTCARIDGINYISELWIGLGGPISMDSDLSELIQSAPTTSSSTTRRPCQRGRVYQVGG